jgi:hypothetical protein
MARYGPRGGKRARRYRTAQIIRDILYDMNNVAHEIIHIYFDEFLPVF